MSTFEKILLCIIAVTILLLGGIILSKKPKFSPSPQRKEVSLPIEEVMKKNTEPSSSTSLGSVVTETPQSVPSQFSEYYTNTTTGFSFKYKKGYLANIFDFDPTPRDGSVETFGTKIPKGTIILLDTEPFPEDTTKITDERITSSQMLTVSTNSTKADVSYKVNPREQVIRNFTMGSFSCTEYEMSDGNPSKNYIGINCSVGKNKFTYIRLKSAEPLLDIGSVILN